MLIQTLLSAILGYCLYKIVIEQSDGRHSTRKSVATSTTSVLFCFGIAIPFIVFEPLYLISALDIQHTGLRMVLMAMPISNSMRITEGEKQIMHNRGFYVLIQIVTRAEICFLLCSFVWLHFPGQNEESEKFHNIHFMPLWNRVRPSNRSTETGFKTIFAGPAQDYW